MCPLTHYLPLHLHDHHLPRHHYYVILIHVLVTAQLILRVPRQNAHLYHRVVMHPTCLDN
jgi:hypothetical protein